MVVFVAVGDDAADDVLAALDQPGKIWEHQIDEPLRVQMERKVRDWPPRISAYDVYLQYQAKGAKDWTACKTWDPIIVNRDIVAGQFSEAAE